MQSASKTGDRAIGAAIAYLAAHAFIAVLLPLRLAASSTACIVVAQLLALWACLRAAGKTDGPARVLWQLMALMTALHAVAMSLDLRIELLGIEATNPSPGLQILFSSLHCVPVLCAVSVQFDVRVQRAIRILYAILASALGIVFYVLVFSLVTLRGTTEVASLLFLVRLFGVVGFFLATAATIRAIGTEDLGERRFFYICAVFFWVMATLQTVHNLILMHHDFVWLDVLISAPYILLTVLILRDPPAAVQRGLRSGTLVRLVRSGSPVFLSMGLLMLGILVSRIHFYVGAAAALTAILCYGALNVLTQSRGLEAEESLLEAKRTLEQLVAVDSLTGISNRRAFDEKIGLECRAATRTDRPLSLLMIDVDHFKQLNDAMGHLTGDEYLMKIAKALKTALPRATDMVSRYGGEEFAALLPATDSAGAMQVAERLHASVESLALQHAGSPAGRITVSIGVATASAGAPPSPLSLIETADKSLYRAKAMGRNRTECQAPAE